MNRIIQAILNDRTAYTNDMFENICEDFYNGVCNRIINLYILCNIFNKLTYFIFEGEKKYANLLFYVN